MFWKQTTASSQVYTLRSNIELQESQDVGSHISHSATGIVSLDRPSLTVDEELFEIPTDVVVPDRRVKELSSRSKEISCAETARFEESEEGMFPGSIDLYLPEYCHFGLEIVSRPDVTDPVQHLQIRCSWFLLSKLVAREGEDGQILSEFGL